MTTEKKTTEIAVVDQVSAKVAVLQKSQGLVLPQNYAMGNALRSAWLILQEQDLSKCTQPSIANALLDMVIQGLSPVKKQCYFITYGNKLVCMRSYFGAMAMAKEKGGAKEVYAEVVYKDDRFSYEIVKGNKINPKHEQKPDNIGGPIEYAYCVIEYEDDRPDYLEVMTMEQIHKSWKKSKMSPDSETSTHKQFPDQMCKRTVINRACKVLINSSSDDDLFLKSFNRGDDISAEYQLEEGVEANADGEIIEIEGEAVTSETDENPLATGQADGKTKALF